MAHPDLKNSSLSPESLRGFHRVLNKLINRIEQKSLIEAYEDNINLLIGKINSLEEEKRQYFPTAR